MTAPTANSTAITFDHLCASVSAASSPWRSPRQFAISVMAGKATPRQARMMWKPSVKAIWLRAGSSSGESASRPSTSAGEPMPRA